MKRLSSIPLYQLEALSPVPPMRIGPLSSAMTPDDSLSLILRRLDEIERKLDRIMEELRAPTAIGYSVGRGNRPRED